MNCKKCHEKLSDDTKFCSNCGHAVEIEEVKKESTEIDFYYISPLRFIILSVLTFGIYQVFWFYKNWQLIKKTEGTKIFPLIRSIIVLYSLPLFEKVIDSAKKHGFKNRYSAGVLAMVYIILFIAPNFISDVNGLDNTLPLYILFNLLSILPLLYIQKVIKYNNSKINTTSFDKKFSAKEVIIVLVGIAVSIAVFNGLENANKYGSFTKPADGIAIEESKDGVNEVPQNEIMNSNINTTPIEYQINIIQIGGIGSRVTNKSAYNLEDNGYLSPIEDYVNISFNTPVDLMWVYCRDGYSVNSVSSPTGNETGNVPDYGANLSIEEKYKNTISVKCVLNNTTKQ